MSGYYELWLTDDYGVRLKNLNSYLSFSASKVDLGMGKINIDLPQSFDLSLFNTNKLDRMVQVWRAPNGGKLSLWNVYFIRKWNFKMSGNSEEITISGPDIKDLLRRRIVAAYAGTEHGVGVDFADNIMKSVVRNSMLNSIAPLPSAGTRAWANLSVQGDTSLGPEITKEFSFDVLMSGSAGGVLPSLSKAAKAAGTEVFFDIIPNVVTSNSINFLFITKTGQPGQDVSDTVVFSQESGNLKEPELEIDYTEEENYIYAGGQGEGTERSIQQVYDATRYGLSQWNRCEGFADVSSVKTADAIREAGRNRLEEFRPKIYFSGIPVDTAGTRFGRDWNWGDKVTAKYRNYQFLSIIRSVVISVDSDGAESIQTRLEYSNE
jgi:hypothetical protein